MTLKSAWLIAAVTTIGVGLLEIATVVRMIPAMTVVDAAALSDKGRQCGPDHHGGDILDPHSRRVDGYAAALQHIGNHLGGEKCLTSVAGSVQTDQ